MNHQEKINGLTLEEFKYALRTYAFFNRVMFWNKKKRGLSDLLWDAYAWIDHLESKLKAGV